MILWLLLFALSLVGGDDVSTRYLLIYNWPRHFGNMIITLSEALLIAKELNRVLIIPPVGQVIDIVKIATSLDVPVIYGVTEWPFSLIGSRLMLYSFNGVTQAHEGPYRVIHPHDGNDVIHLDHQILSFDNNNQRSYLRNSTSLMFMTYKEVPDRIEIAVPTNRISNIVYERRDEDCLHNAFDLSPPYSYPSFANSNAANFFDPCFLQTLSDATDHLSVFALNVAWYSVDWRSHLAFYHGFYRLLRDQMPSEPEQLLKKLGINELAIGIHMRLYKNTRDDTKRKIIAITKSVKNKCAEWANSHTEKCNIFVGSNMIEHGAIRGLLSRLRAIPNTRVISSKDTEEAIGSHEIIDADEMIRKRDSRELFLGNEPDLNLIWDVKLFSMAKVFMCNFASYSTLSMAILGIRQSIGRHEIIHSPWPERPKMEAGMIYPLTIHGVIFPNDFGLSSFSLYDFFDRVQLKLAQNFRENPEEEGNKANKGNACLLVPSGRNTKHPSWNIRRNIAMARYNPLLVIAARSPVINQLARLCYGESWWTRLMYLTRISNSLTPEERLVEYSGFVIHAYRRLTRPWTGSRLISFTDELRQALIGSTLSRDDALKLLTLPNLNIPYDPDPAHDFRLTYKTPESENISAKDKYVLDIMNEHVFSWKHGFHVTPADGEAELWFDKLRRTANDHTPNEDSAWYEVDD